MITYLEKIKLIELDYFQESHHTLSSDYKFLDGVYSIKKEIIMDSDNSNVSDIDKMRGMQSLDHFQELIDHQIKRRMNNRASVLTTIATIFLPLNFIVSYFGMNFKSMGAPTLKDGILNLDHAQYYIFFFALFCILIVTSFFSFFERLLIPSAPRYNFEKIEK